MNAGIHDLTERLTRRLRSYGTVAVALSGGVDSAVVAFAARLALGDGAVAVTAVSPSLARTDLESARRTAAEIGIRHVELVTSEFARPEYRANAGDRCYYCKDTLYSVTESRLQELGVRVMTNGANLDDLGDHRPGMRAAADHRVRSPLIEEQIGKDGVRQLAAHWNLSVADRPAAPCLASRVAYGVEVTAERVERIEAAEAFLRELLGIRQLRVRLESAELARIELPLDVVSRAVEPSVRVRIVQRLSELGFRAVTIDLAGFRSGNLNDTLPFVPLAGARSTPASE